MKIAEKEKENETTYIKTVSNFIFKMVDLEEITFKEIKFRRLLKEDKPSV